LGRTVATYRLALESMAQQWNDFRRALRKGDREAFDALMNRARMHASAATYAISLDPTESALLSMLLEHEKEILALRKELEKKEDGEEQDGGRSESGQ
jgi:DNA-binding response OmpR family regulator